MTLSSDFTPLRTVVSDLSLTETDFSDSGGVTDAIAAFKTEILALDASSEPWLTEWLTDEHYKAGVFFTAGQVNWNHEQLGKGTALDRRMRATIVSRFNEWVAEIQDRLDKYEKSSRFAADVADWRDELARFRADPVRYR